MRRKYLQIGLVVGAMLVIMWGLILFGLQVGEVINKLNHP
jgi:hypothetical protein